MYPYLINIWQFQVSSFWLSITLWFFLFVYMLYKMSKKLDFSLDIFKNNLLWYFISIFFFSRLFFLISRWQDFRFIENPAHFFITNEYNFSLIWAIFWFFIVFFILLKLRKEKLEKYIYWIMVAFLFVLPLWYIWALLWGQIYGIDTNFWIEITYTRADTPVPFTSPLFPLPIVYSILFFILFSWLYILDMYVKEKEILWYASLIIFSCIVFTMEFFSGKNDLLKEYIFLNLNQIWVLFIFLFWVNKIYRVYKKEIRRWQR